MSHLGQNDIECPACEKFFTPADPQELGEGCEIDCPHCGAVIILSDVVPDTVFDFYGELKEAKP